MKRITKQNTYVLICSILMAVILLPAVVDAAKDENKIASGMVQQYLQQQGITLRMLPMQRQDGFTRAISIESVSGQSVTIGFTDTPFDDGLFLLQYQDDETIFQAQEDGSVRLIAGQQINIQYILCMLDAVLAFIDDAKTCEQNNAICYARAILSLVMYAMNCSDSTTTTTIAG